MFHILCAGYSVLQKLIPCFATVTVAFLCYVPLVVVQIWVLFSPVAESPLGDLRDIEILVINFRNFFLFCSLFCNLAVLSSVP
jgi:hypothetical protein